MGELPVESEVVIIGGGPGGYAAAFRAADLGLDVTLINDEERLGGTCLLRGCIPSKTLLYPGELMQRAAEAEAMGLRYGEPAVDLERMRTWKEEVVERLTDGLATLCEQRGVQRLHGRARFESPETLRVEGPESTTVRFHHAVVATGSRARLPDPLQGSGGGRVMTSTEALELPEVPERLLVVGGGYVGVEMGSVYAALGSRVTLVQGGERLLPAADEDLVRPLQKRLKGRFEALHLNTRVAKLEEDDDAVRVHLGEEEAGSPERFDRVLVATGRRPNTDDLGLETTAVEQNDDGSIRVNEARCTHDSKVYAVGDAAGGMLLAHKAMHEGWVAAEAIAGRAAAFDARAVPAVVYSDPQVAWCGLTEQAAGDNGMPVRVLRFPWSASGRAVSM
ncbi:MAG TPA: NAD(P)/FAD-dependent oxidoreductase, partial [Gammaproteobacteria bacterium]|nr:NAD(P)/FAD-dependent oxidoreductase [Gammaproteobacteria bacterium]